MFGALVHFVRDDIIGNDVVETRVGVIPLIAVERDSAGPTIISTIAARGGRDVAVVIDYVVVGGQVVALDRANAGPAGIADAVADEAQMMRTATKEAVTCLASAVQIKPAEFEVGGIRRKAAAVHIEHRGCIRGAGPYEFDWCVAVVSIDDPC